MDRTGEDRARPRRAGRGTISVAETRDGCMTYLVTLGTEQLPAVAGRDLRAAWDAARDAAARDAWGVARAFRFQRQDGEATDLVLADADACAWAGAIDARAGLATAHGLSLCLRLLALVELIATASWAAALCEFRRDGAALHPALLDAAGRLPLTSEGRLDETLMRAQVGLRLP